MRTLAACVFAGLLTPLLAGPIGAASISQGGDLMVPPQALTNPINISVSIASASDNGTGQVTSNPAGIDCGTTCSAMFEFGTPMSLTAEGTNGSTFAGWQSEVCTGQGGTCSFDVPPVSIEITALFSGIGPPISQPPPSVPGPTPTMGVPSSPRPSARASTKPTSKAGATRAPASTAAQGETTRPGATAAPGASIEPGTTETSPEESLAPMETPDPADSAAGEGGVPVLLLVLLIGVAAIVVGGGTYFAIRRREGTPPPGA